MVKVEDILKELGKIGDDKDKLNYLFGLLKIIRDKKIKREIERLIEQIKKPVEKKQIKINNIEKILQDTPVITSFSDVEVEDFKYEPIQRPSFGELSSQTKEKEVKSEPGNINYFVREERRGIEESEKLSTSGLRFAFSRPDRAKRNGSMFSGQHYIPNVPDFVSGEVSGSENIRMYNPTVKSSDILDILKDKQKSMEEKYKARSLNG